jgi:hypothetical protein
MAQDTKESVYVLFGTKGKYRLSIRSPAMYFGGARIHIDCDDGTLVFPEDSLKVFNLRSAIPSKEKMGSYVTVTYDLFSTTKSGTETTLINRMGIGHYPDSLIPPFEWFLDYLESKNVELRRDVAIAVYMDTVQESLVEQGFFPAKGNKPEMIEPMFSKAGGVVFKNGSVVKERE